MPIRYNEAVEKVIAEVFPRRDAFDDADYDPIAYLNTCFPNEASLSALPAFLDETSSRLRLTENELLKEVEAQTTCTVNSEQELMSTREAVANLYKKVSDIKSKATQSESTVRDLCRHILELDIAKTNLTASINTLRSVQLWMLQLQTLSTSFERRRYIQCRDALQEAKKYSAQFADMKDIPKVKELNDKQTQLCRRMEYYICNTIFDNISLESLDKNTMAEACAIVDLMEPTSIKKIRDRFVDKLLGMYMMRFKRGSEDATLERTERRYVYIRTLLEKYADVFSNVFPRHWCVPQELCVTFCLRTKQELDYHLRLAAEGGTDVVVLTYVLQKTIDIERDLTHMTAWREEFSGQKELPVYKYNGLILSAFKEHMGLFVQNEDKLMGEALAQPLEGQGDATCVGWKGEEDVQQGTVLPLAEDIFVFIKESLKRALRIAQSDVLLDMAKVWIAHLVRFAERLLTLLPSPALTALDVRRASLVINTVDFCHTTSRDLGEEVCVRSEAPASEVGFAQVIDAFLSVYSKSIQAVILGLEKRLAPLLAEYASGAFIPGGTGTSSSGGLGVDDTSAQDESKLIRTITTVLHDLVLNCAAVLPPSTLRFLLDKVATVIIPKYTNLLYRFKRLSDEAVGVMRVDGAALEKTFLQLPNYNDPTRFQASALTGYMRLVRREFENFHRALKILQVDVHTDAFLDVYYEVTLPEHRSIQNFVRLVELKGLTRDDVRPWIASLSKRGVVEATRRELMRDASFTTATSVASQSAGVSDSVRANGASGGGGGNLNFAALFSRDSFPLGEVGGGFSLAHLMGTLAGDSHSSGALSPAPNERAIRDGVEEETFGTRFANAARTTATSIGFLNKFKI